MDYSSDYFLRYYHSDHYVQIELLVKVIIVGPRDKQNDLCSALGLLVFSKQMIIYRKKEIVRDMLS